MYPDRATFERMVEEEPDLSGAGRQTLLALYDGPLRIRQILATVNGKIEAGGSGERAITESALRKRLELLITRGLIARAGSERTNPYYFIRRPWLFNRYVLIRCRENPAGGLLDLKILLGEIARHTADTPAGTVQPRVISAIGERTERSHELAADYAAFRQRLGDPAAVGEYLEGIYDTIYTGQVPASDIDSSLVRDFLRFVATAPPEEHEVRFFFWYAQFFLSLDLYEEASGIYEWGAALARDRGYDLAAILADARISRGSILAHLDNFTGAQEAYLAGARDSSAGPLAQAKNLLGAGEMELVCGTAGQVPETRFSRALELAIQADPDQRNPEVTELRADILRGRGTVSRLAFQYDRAEQYYAEAETVCPDDLFLGRARLLPDQAELARARAFATPAGPAADRYLVQAAGLYDEAKAAAQRIRSISRFASALIGECELARISCQKFKKPLPRDIDVKYANAFAISCQIGSKRGIAQCFISEALLYHAMGDTFPEKYADTADKLAQADEFCRDLGLATGRALIKRIRAHADPAAELNPLVFL